MPPQEKIGPKPWNADTGAVAPMGYQWGAAALREGYARV
jgi:hypothetical protein